MTVLAFRPRTAAPLIRTPMSPAPRMVMPAVSWWTCPDWCIDAECRGGAAYDFGRGPGSLSSRTHHGVIHTEQVLDLNGGHADIRVEVTAIEEPDEGYVDSTYVDIQVDTVTNDLDAAERIAHAILAAVHHARQPLPAVKPQVSA